MIRTLAHGFHIGNHFSHAPLPNRCGELARIPRRRLAVTHVCCGAGALAKGEAEAKTLWTELEQGFPGRVCVVVSQEPVDLVEQAQRDLGAIDRPAPNSSSLRWDDRLRLSSGGRAAKGLSPRRTATAGRGHEPGRGG